jgi:hypothetical protein
MPPDLNAAIERLTKHNGQYALLPHEWILILRHVRKFGWPLCESPQRDEWDSYRHFDPCGLCPPCLLNKLVEGKG